VVVARRCAPPPPDAILAAEGTDAHVTGRQAQRASPFGSAAAVARNRELRRVELAFLGFNVAEWSTWVAILVFAYDHGGVTAAGVVALVQLVPAAVVAPFAALLGDRYRRERVLRVGYVVQSALMGSTAAALLLGSPAAAAYALAAASATSLVVTRPVQGSLLPALCETPEELTAANATSTAVEGASILAGPALTALLLAVGSPGAVYAVMSIWLLASAILVWRLRAGSATDAVAGLAAGGIVADALAGFRSVASASASRVLVTIAAVQTVVWGALDVLIVALAIEVLRTGDAGPGSLNSVLGAGALVGGVASVSLAGRRRLAPALALGVALWGAPLVVIGIFPHGAVAIAMLLFVGAGHPLMDVAGRTLLQRTVDDEVLARVLGVVEGLMMAGLAVGSIAAPILVHAFGIPGAFVVAGVLLPALTLAMLRPLASADAAASAPVRELAVLRSIPLFAPLGAAELERVARDLEAMSLPAGIDVVRQGEPGDRFFVVDRGTVDVLVDGRVVQRLVAGDHFGEIALLRDVPRTATVRTASAVDLLALPRDRFLAAVTGSPQAAAAAEAIVAARLPTSPSTRPGPTAARADRVG
jgi:MFS family permease